MTLPSGTPAAAEPEPKVYLDYTQAELDRAYEQRAWASNAEQMMRWYAEQSAAARARLPHRYDVAYGDDEDERLDIFPAVRRPAAGALAPVHVHLHGGRWRILSKDETSVIAPTFVEAGVAFVTLNFSLIPKVRLPDMIAQLRRAIAWVHANATSFGGDANRIHLSGHSSGAHLAGVLLTTDWRALGLPENLIKSAVLMSGMYDMRPVMLSERASYVKLSAAEVLDLSAILHVGRINAPLVLGYGSMETPEFQRHPQAFAATLRAAGKPVSVLTVAGANHYEMLRELADANTPLSRAALAATGLTA